MDRRMIKRHVPFALPDVGEREIQAVTDVLRSGWLTSGEQCQLFEQEFAEAVGGSHAVALNSGTAALHLSLEALDVSADDLVFMSPYTFAASAEVVHYLGARPVFVDIDRDSLNIDTSALRDAVRLSADAGLGKPRVIMPVHIAGLPCDIEDVWSLAWESDLAVVEDAAHGFPSSHLGHRSAPCHPTSPAPRASPSTRRRPSRPGRAGCWSLMKRGLLTVPER